MANIKYYSNCGGCNATWALAHMKLILATLYCHKCYDTKMSEASATI